MVVVTVSESFALLGLDQKTQYTVREVERAYRRKALVRGGVQRR